MAPGVPPAASGSTELPSKPRTSVRGPSPLPVAAAVFALLALSRLCHLNTLWVEEAYPMAGALQMLAGQFPYRDFWYDKPPLTPLFYLLCGAYPGWPLRILGTLFAIACCYVAYRFARDLWDEAAGLWAALLLAFFLTFDHHAASIAIAPDVFLLLPHLAAVWLAHRKQPLLAGLALAVGLAANAKAILFLPVCLLFAIRPDGSDAPVSSPRRKPGGALLLTLLGLTPAALLLLLPGFREQVLAWGAIYSADTFVTNPLTTGLTKTLAWCGFHIALLVAATRAKPTHHFALWLALALVSTTLGQRFAPRYYFALLPPLVLLAARGFAIAGPKTRYAAAALLLIPLVRFGPRYAQLAAGQPWQDLALYQDSRWASDMMPNAKSVFVWGYRPEINVLTHAPSLDFYIESQPLTGVFADRHLANSKPSAQSKSMHYPLRSEYIVDGLGPLNPSLAIPGRYLINYEYAWHTMTTVIYRSKGALASPKTP